MGSGRRRAARRSPSELPGAGTAAGREASPSRGVLLDLPPEDDFRYSLPHHVIARVPHKMPTIEQIEEMLRREPDDVFLTYSAAMLLARENRAEEALARFDRVLELDADYVPAYFQKGMFQAGRGDVDEAHRTLARGIERATATGDTHARGEMEEFLATL